MAVRYIVIPPMNDFEMADQYALRVQSDKLWALIEEKKAKPIPPWGSSYLVYYYEEEEDEVCCQSSTGRPPL